jgi:large subunit ribosomal protein L16
MLFPKKIKYRKWQTGRKDMATAKPDTRGTTLSYGSFGIKVTAAGRIRSNQLEAARKAMSRHLTKTGKAWTRIFPDRPYTAKPAEVGMGKGKGDPQGFCMEVRPGRVIFEVDGMDEATAREALRKAGTKLPLKTRIISRA